MKISGKKKEALLALRSWAGPQPAMFCTGFWTQLRNDLETGSLDTTGNGPNPSFKLFAHVKIHAFSLIVQNDNFYSGFICLAIPVDNIWNTDGKPDCCLRESRHGSHTHRDHWRRHLESVILALLWSFVRIKLWSNPRLVVLQLRHAWSSPRRFMKRLLYRAQTFWFNRSEVRPWHQHFTQVPGVVLFLPVPEPHLRTTT